MWSIHLEKKRKKKRIAGGRRIWTTLSKKGWKGYKKVKQKHL
jgi:hypothetical protein